MRPDTQVPVVILTVAKYDGAARWAAGYPTHDRGPGESRAGGGVSGSVE